MLVGAPREGCKVKAWGAGLAQGKEAAPEDFKTPGGHEGRAL